MTDISFKQNNKKIGAWPLYAEYEELQLQFSLNWTSSSLRFNLAKNQSSKVLDIIFIALAVSGITALVMHFVSPLFDWYLRFFAFTLLTGLTFWTKKVSDNKSVVVEGDKLDLIEFFDKESLNILRKAILSRGNSQANSMHLFLQLLRDEDVKTAFYRLGVGYRQLAQSFLPYVDNLPSAPPVISNDLAELPFLAYKIKEELQIEKITPIVLLAAATRLPDENLTSQVLYEYALDKDIIYRTVRWQVVLSKIISRRAQEYSFIKLKPKGEINRSLTSVPTPVLDSVSSDLTLRARLGRLPVVVGRDKDFEKVNSAFTSDRIGVLIVGEPGVGKTSIVDLLSEKMLTEDVPPRLQDKRLVRLDLAKVLGAGDNSGQILGAAIKDAHRGGNIVLVIENVHEWAKAQSNGVTLLSILTSIASDTGIPMVATTTPQGFQDAAVLSSSSMFERVDIEEVSFDDAVLITSIHASLLESRFRIFWTMEAIQKSVELSSRYIQTNKQPQKAIKVVEVVSERVAARTNDRIAVIGEEDVEAAVSELAHVDAEDVSGDEAEKLLNLEKGLHQRIVGQNEAVKAVANAMRRAKANLGIGKEKPLASFLFVGPTGVGKTELAKALADIEFGSKDLLIRLDLSEYNLPESTDKLLGSRTHISSFVSQVKEYPYSVVLLDELEKAHPDIQNVFLQVLDEGSFTDNAGNKVDLTNTIIIATSNAAAIQIKEGFESNTDYENLQSKLVHKILPDKFRPELLNRFDGIILFKPLSVEDVAQIVKLQLKNLAADLDKQGVGLETTDKGAMIIAKAAFDPDYGARSLRRYIQDNIENKIADWILAHKLNRRDSVIINDSGEVEIKKSSPV